MKFLYFSQLLAIPMAVFFGGVAGTYISITTSCVSATTAPTATTTVTVTVTQTSTSTVFETKTRKEACPAYETGVLNFDDLPTSGISPMPSVYQDFSFYGSAAGWLYYAYNAFPVNSWEFLSVNSYPNALLSRSTGLVSIGSQGRGFSFDITSVAFSAYTPNVPYNTTLIVEVKLLMADEYSQTLYFEHPNGVLNGTKPVVLGQDDLAGLDDLVEVSVAVWQTYDNTTGEGIPADFVLDDIKYVKRRCGY